MICASHSASAAGRTPGSSRSEHLAQVADQGYVHAHVLIDFGAVNLDVDFLGLGRVGAEFSRHAIVEAHAQGDQQIGFLNGFVDPGFAVHAHHAQVQRMRRRERAQPEQRERHRNPRFFGQRVHFALGAGKNDAVAGENDRPLGLIDESERGVEFLLTREENRLVAMRLGRRGFPIEIAGGLLGVLGDVQQHRARTVGSRNLKGFAQARSDVLGARDQIVVLGDRAA